MSKPILNKFLNSSLQLPHPYVFGEFLTSHPPLIAQLQRLEKGCAEDISLLLVGETGTGKEMLARAVHKKSLRCNGPFVIVDCGAIAASIIESELFGHEPGAFTDAKTKKRGLTELAHKGTLFLDEVGDMPPACQVKLLRLLQSKEIMRLGSTQTIHVDCRFMSATNKNLPKAIKSGEFREDLYYRLSAVCFEIPPLRSRRGDIVVLGQHFFERYVAKHNSQVLGVSPLAWENLLSWDWPGNVRELENVIQQAVVVCEGNWVELSDLPDLIQSIPMPERRLASVEPQQGQSLKESLARLRSLLEQQLILQALEQNGWNVNKTASALKISRSALYRRISAHQIKKS